MTEAPTHLKANIDIYPVFDGWDRLYIEREQGADLPAVHIHVIPVRWEEMPQAGLRQQPRCVGLDKKTGTVRFWPTPDINEKIVIDPAPVDPLRLLIAKHFNVDLSRVVDQAKFIEDLGGDSLDRTELAFLVEDEFGVDIDSLTHQPATVGELIQAVREAQVA